MEKRRVMRGLYLALCVLCGIVLFLLATHASADVPAPPELKSVAPKFTHPHWRVLVTYENGEKRCWFYEFDPQTGHIIPADNMPIWQHCLPLTDYLKGRA